MGQLMKIVRLFAFLLVSLSSLPLIADHIVLSAYWDGNEAKMPAYDGTCHGAGDLGYRQFNAVQVSSDGEYHIADASDSLPGDVMIAVYDTDFDPDFPETNLIATFDQGGFVTLESGRDHIVVVQHWCANVFPDTFGVSLSGPGNISGADIVMPPDWTYGNLGGPGPEADFGGITRKYAVAGPLTVPDTGLYYMADVGLFGRLDTELRVYEDAFNPDETEDRLVASVDDSGSVSLIAGKNYVFVTTAHTQGNSGAWQWVLFPPGPLHLNAGLNGAWSDPAIDGQGILIDVLPEFQMVFVAWFTFDLQRPEGGTGPMIGDDGHRWLTAYGNYEAGDNSVSLSIQNVTGGVFDSASPAVELESDYGSIELQFSDCLNGTMTYDIPAGPVGNVIPISRVSADHLDLCAILGSPGPAVISD
jgi:hypothetical protein